MATCGKPIGKGVMSFLCDLDAGHEGPHRAHGNDRSIRERSEWEQAQRDLRMTQGAPQTSAQRWGDGDQTGTPPPGFFPCAYHRVIHHNDVRSPKCIAWSGPHDGDRPTTIQRLPESMGVTTHFGALPDMADDPQKTRPDMVYEGSGTTFKEKDLDEVDPRVLAGEPIEVEGDFGIEPTRSVPREGEQGLPVKNERGSAQDALIQAIEHRKEIGLIRYGTLLQPFNGRDSWKDFFDEAIDGAIYAMALDMERVEIAEDLRRVHEFLVLGIGMEAEVTLRVKRALDWMTGATTITIPTS